MKFHQCCFIGITVLTLCSIPAVPLEAGLFYPSVQYEAGDYPQCVAIGDLNGDGNPDLTTANFWSDNVSVLLGKGDGTFQTAVNYGVGSGPSSVAIGDLDGDSYPDLAVANSAFYGSGDVSILRGNGDGTFQANVSYLAGDSPKSVTIGDLDGDGNPDLAVADEGSANAWILLGNGDGTFQTAVNYGVGSGPSSVAIGDLDGDSYPDLAVTNSLGNRVSVLLGNGDGTFQERVNYAAGRSPSSVAIGDLNGDGIPDLAVATWEVYRVQVLLGHGDGTFQERVSYGVGNGPESVAIGDLDGDGNPDLVVAVLFGNSASVLAGNGDGTFQDKVVYGAGSNPKSVAIGDLNGDGSPDLAVANQGDDNISVLINTNATIEGTVSVTMTCTPPTGTLPFRTTITVGLTNNYIGYYRRMAARVDVFTGGGIAIPDWKSGEVDISPGFTISPVFSLILPAHPTVLGSNLFTLTANDVTPAPYNQPPHPPSGDTDTTTCTVWGIEP